MPRTTLIALLALIAIFCAVIFSGCSSEPQDVNNTASNDTAPAFGHVYLGNKTVAGARIEAVSLDGSLYVATRTNASGTYTLNLVPGVKYDVTATYSGLKHTITPVYLHDPVDFYTDVADQYDIYLTKRPSSTLRGLVSPKIASGNGSGALIIAVGTGGAWQAALIDNGSYSFDPKPGVSYILAGNYTDPYGQNGYVRFVYRNDDFCSGFTAESGKTILIDTRVMAVHPPKNLFWTIENTSEMPRFLPSTPVSISGHVYLDGKPVSHASVQAIAAENNVSVQALTDDSGAYVMGLMSKTLYRLVATYQGKQCIVKPVFLKDNMTGAYDIYITSQPRQGMMGVWHSDWGVGALQGKITIQAAPIYGGATVNKIFDAAEGYFLDLEPGVYYNVSGTFRDAAGQDRQVYLIDRLGGSCQRILVRPGETVLVDYYIVPRPAEL